MKRLILCLLMACLLPVTPNANANPEKQAATEADLKFLADNIQQLKQLLNELNAERSSLEKQLQKTEAEMVNTRQSIRSLEKRIQKGQDAVKKLQSRQKALSAKIESEKSHIADSLRSAYLASRDSRLKLFLNQENPEGISRQLVYLEYLQEAQIAAIKSFESDLQEKVEVERQQLSALEQLESERAELNKKKGELEQTHLKRSKLVSRINTRLSSSDRQLSELSEQKVKLEAILSKLALEIAAGKPFKTAKGKLTWPLKGSIIHRFREYRSDTRLRWDGIVVRAKAGTQVGAVHDGIVVFSGWLRGYGQLTILDHGNQYLTLYAYNDYLLKKEGEKVLAGEAIAISGQTGGLSEPGLYFEVRHNGVPQDPASWLRS